jgi:hypothetical protein
MIIILTFKILAFQSRNLNCTRPALCEEIGFLLFVGEVYIVHTPLSIHTLKKPILEIQKKEHIIIFTETNLIKILN